MVQRYSDAGKSIALFQSLCSLDGEIGSKRYGIFLRSGCDGKLRFTGKRSLQHGNPQNSEGSQHGSENREEDYLNEQYYLEDDKYKQLEDRLNAVENLKMSGLNFDDLSLVPGVVIPPKFKVPTFAKYDGISCPKLHLKSYVQKINPHTDDRKLWMHYFQESLSGTQLEWYYQLENDRIRTWSDLADAFYRQYEYNAELTPTHMQIQSMFMGRDEKFKEYAQKWRDLTG